MPLWKRIVLVSLGITFGVCVAGGLIVYSVYWYYNHSRPLKTWPERAIDSNGLKLLVETKWRDSGLSYRVLVSPLPPRTDKDFDSAVSSPSDLPDLDLVLEDSDRIALCSISVPRRAFVRTTNDRKLTTGLEAEDRTYSCDLKLYKEAAFLDIHWNQLPNVTLSPSDFQPTMASAKPGARNVLNEKEAALLGLYGSVVNCAPAVTGAFLYGNDHLSGSPISLLRQGDVLMVWPSAADGSYAAQEFDYKTQKIVRSGFIATDCLAKTWPRDKGINNGWQ